MSVAMGPPTPSFHPTLREAADACCKQVMIGTAILPKPLFQYDPEIDFHSDKISDNNPTTTEPLKNATISCPLRYPHLQTEEELTTYAKVLVREFNSVVIEHHLKWSPLCHTLPGPINPTTPSDRLGRYDFYHVDAMVDFALSRGMIVKGHTLIWHVTSPVEFLESLTPMQVEEEMKRHIFTTMGHFRGRIKMWDVVNEALSPDGSLANNIFLQKIGPSYIEKAFRWAHEADPTALLIYNDNKVEGADSPNPKKSDAYYQLLKSLVSAKVPIHGAGMQAHFNAGGEGTNSVPTPYSVKTQIKRIGNLGLKVHFSEFDVRVSKLPVHVQEIAQRQIYHDIIAAALTEPAFDGVWLWGFTDRHTWVKNFYYDDSPLILDQCYNEKECYFGLLDALKTLNIDGKVGGSVHLEGCSNPSDRPWGSDWIQERTDESKSNYNHTATGDERPDWCLESK
jgi:endo-1,4-beta-xylanase